MARITEEDKKYLLSLKPNDITYELGMELFSDRIKKENGKIIEVKSRFEPTDLMFLKAGEYINKTDIETTVGKFIFNKFIIEPLFTEYLDYVNQEITDSGLGKFEGVLSDLLLNDKITTKTMHDYFGRIQWLGMQFHEPLAASFTMRGLKPVDKIIKRRDQLIKENKEALEKGDIMTMSKIQKQLVDMVANEVGDDPSFDLYYSGARGSISNNYKQMSIVKGPVFNKAIGKYQFIQNSLYEGVRKEDIAASATNVTNGAYPKACGTAVSGYKAKQVSSLGQAVILRKDIKDCGTKGYVEIVIPAALKNKFLYRYIIDKNGLTLLTADNIDSYVGKKIKLRSIMFCGADSGVCMTCAGKQYEQIEIDAIGLTTSTLTGALLNLKMKAFHDASVKVTPINLDDMTF